MTESASPPGFSPVRQTDDPMTSGDEKPAGYTNTDEPRDGSKRQSIRSSRQ